MKTPNFDMMEPWAVSRAWNAWEKSDVGGIMILVGHHERGDVLEANIEAFLDRGIYEAALFECYTHGPHYSPDSWRNLIGLADRAKLLAQGDALPTKPITVYRGISHSGHKEWIRGLSWTTNPNTAAWFATRKPRPGRFPAVYSILARPKDILLMTNVRAEEDVALAFWKGGHVKRLIPMPRSIKPQHAK